MSRFWNTLQMRLRGIVDAVKRRQLRRRQRGLLKLMGKFDWDPTYDYKAERSRDHKLFPDTKDTQRR